MPVSDPKVQFCFSILENPHKWGSQLWNERNEEIREFARLATWKELDVTEEEFRLYSNGVKPPKGEMHNG